MKQSLRHMKALKLDRNTVAGVVMQVEVVPRKGGQTENRRVESWKIDNF